MDAFCEKMASVYVKRLIHRVIFTLIKGFWCHKLIYIPTNHVWTDYMSSLDFFFSIEQFKWWSTSSCHPSSPKAFLNSEYCLAPWQSKLESKMLPCHSRHYCVMADTHVSTRNTGGVTHMSVCETIILCFKCWLTVANNSWHLVLSLLKLQFLTYNQGLLPPQMTLNKDFPNKLLILCLSSYDCAGDRY